MEWLARLQLDNFLLFTLVLSRLSGLVMTVPVFGTPDIPMQVRALLAFTLALLITPTQWGAGVADPGSLANYLVLVGGELLIGVAIGLGVVILFSGVQLAGEIIGRLSGETLAEVFDPASGNNLPLYSHLLYLTALAVFVSIGGHRIVMTGLLDTFQAIPIARATLPEGLSGMCVSLITQSFSLGLRAAAPAITALVMANLVLGLIGRTLPQLNILAIGFGVNSLLTYGVVILSLGAAIWAFQGQIEPMLETVQETLQSGTH